ncbi:PTS lactose/cellobiose transporter subunit IIA [uncultured Anaerococcus sp.]|uniref:PTS lactose/cellobiose transporter subunit IIA n=1 Tax=uncultured Anaerococcus sp. TaxID=293428 RepID=UPI00280541B7|nr:PTS lactose/cellobiose transporter subunit IIA [uncultured Anaerococcus sp.]
MDNEKIYEIAFQIIVHAGESRSLSSESMDAAESYDFERAEALLKQANQEFLNCHKIQTELLTNEANGEKNAINVILIHSQDHLTMATMAMDNAKRWIKINKKFKDLEEKNEKSNVDL